MTSAINSTESNATLMLRLLKKSGLLQPEIANQLPDTGKGLMKLPAKQMTEARLLYE
jgi:hypothetical protein